MTDTMKAWQYASGGNIDTHLKFVEDVRRPLLSGGKDEVLIEVASAALNPTDYKMAELGLMTRVVMTLPKCPGIDFSGRVVSVSSDVADIKPGDHVMGMLSPWKSPGALSQYVISPKKACRVVPATVDLDQAAGVGTAAITAYQTIAPFVKSGDKIFINGGSGGTGTFGIQIAKILGCHVTVTCSTNKMELCKGLGADTIIDYKTASVSGELLKMGKVFALVVDNVGNSPPDLITIANKILLPEGHYKFVGGNTSFDMVMAVGKNWAVPSFLGGPKHKFKPYFTGYNEEHFDQLAKWLSEGKLKTVIDSTFKFNDALKAYEKLKEGSNIGKVVVHVAMKT
jgi:NADPH:quinone reductase-like Zn-dependent oxidoreductase